MHELNLKWLKANCQMIHYFGLGFIQLKTSKTKRFHFYTPELPAIVSEEDIHNHRYDFRSVIAHGSMVQEMYEVTPGNTHLKEEESCQVGVKAECKPESCGIRLSSRHIYNTNSEYFISHDTFHKVRVFGPCITVIDRSDYRKQYAQVIRPVGEASVCPFSKKIEEGALWEIVEKMLSQVN
jgi:hypothetical protein